MECWRRGAIAALAAGLVVCGGFSPEAPALGLPRTGQTISYADYDDGWYAQHGLGNARSYTDNGDGTVTDNATGLVWMSNPILCGPPLDGLLTWQEVLDNEGSFGCPCQDACFWRAPDLFELLTLVDYSRTDPAVNTDFFTVASGVGYWSSTSGWAVELSRPNILTAGGQGMLLHPVLASTPFPHGGPYVANGDGTVTDQSTGLMWVQTPSDAGVGGFYSWTDAIAACEALDYAGYDDWRLPNFLELASMMDFSQSPALPDVFDNGYYTYWSSTSSAVYPGSALALVLDTGEALYPHEYAMLWPIRPVRGPVWNAGASGVEHWELNE